jgi:uncharacterized membrane protein
LDEISLDQGIEIALTALHADRLALLCGAGLSMADPSNLPSAAQLASEAKRTHDTQYGATRPPLPAGIEEQAEYFFQRGELGTVYLRTFIDPHAFAGHPNAGHTDVANLLLVRAIQIAVSTNVAVVVSYTVSSAVLIFSALARAGGTIPDIDPRGALWFAAVGLCNGLAVLAMYAALEYGPVAIISPLIAGYPLVTLLLSRGFLEKEDVGPQLIAGVTGAVCGVVLLLVA